MKAARRITKKTIIETVPTIMHPEHKGGLRVFDSWNDSPCTDCPHHENGYCKFYKKDLEEITPGLYAPCMECDDEYSFSVNGP